MTTHRKQHMTLHLSTSALLTMLIIGCAALAQDTEDDFRDTPPPQRGEVGTRRDDRGQPHRPMGEMERRRPWRGPGDHEPWLKLTDEQIKERLDIIRELNPDGAKRIEDAMNSRSGRQSNRFRQMLHRYWPKIERMRNLKSHDPELYELNVTDERLDRQCRQITMKIRADNGENEETKDELRTLITEHFGVRQRKMEHHVAKLEKRLQNLKKNLEMRRQKRSELEAQRFGELIGASDAVKF